MKFLAVVFFLPLLAEAQTLYVDEQFDFYLTPDVVFASKPIGSPVADVDLQLELYHPLGLNIPTPLPTVILIHGGGFTAGTRFSARLIQMCEGLARRGYACVSIDYRLEGQAPVVSADFLPLANLIEAGGEDQMRARAIAAAVEDGWAAYEWLANNAEFLGIDIERVGIGGSSAGAFIAMAQAYILSDLAITPSNIYGAVFDMWGGLGGAVTMINPDDPPLLITHGADDSVVPLAEAYAIEVQAQSVGLGHEIHVIDDVGHGFDIFSQTTGSGQTVFEEFVDFFYKNLAHDANVYHIPVFPVLAKGCMLGVLCLLGSVALRHRG